jgi:acetyltransferase-like isoleucine patch superfamily enzyme
MIANQWFKLLRRWRLATARRRGVTCADDLRLAAAVDFNLGSGYRNATRPAGSPGRITIGEAGWIEQGAVLWAFDGKIEIGRDVFIGPHAVLYGHGGISIGDHTLISMHCCILSSNHGVPPRTQTIRDQPDIRLATKIGRDCWIGAGAKILGGVTIGDGCVIGAGAVVTTDLPAYSIAVGVPARVVKSRD